MPVEPFHPRVAAWLRTRSAAASPWCVACSGGCDSVAATLLLFARCPQRRKDLRILHFNHGVRGSESDDDEAFVASLSSQLGVPLETGRRNGAQYGVVSERELREFRFAFLLSAMERVGGLALFLGHHRDDLLETMLMRVARGSGSAGLCAPRPVHRFKDGTVRLRPLLHASRKDLERAMRAAGVPWREDSSNRSRQYIRNRLRADVIPRWIDAAGEDVGAGALLTRDLLEEVDVALENWVDQVYPESTENRFLDLSLLRDLPVAVVRRTLHRFLNVQLPQTDFSRGSFSNLLKRMRAGEEGRISAGTEKFLEIREGRLAVVTQTTPNPHWQETMLPVGATLFLPTGGQLRAERFELTKVRRRSILNGEVNPNVEAYIRCDADSFTILRVRPREPGDRYRPVGLSGRIKLQDYFVNSGIPRLERNNIPIVCTGEGSVLWCPGLPPAESAKLNRDTLYSLRLTYRAG